MALSGQGADELFGGYRKHRVASLAGAWNRVPRHRARPRAPRCGAARGAAARLADALAGLRSGGPADRFERARAAGPPRRAVRRRAGRARAAPPRRSWTAGSPARRAPGRSSPRSTRRPSRARGRHAHLLRPRLDGVLARGARAVPRPRARRAVRARIPPEHKVRRLHGKHVLRLAARGPVPEFVLAKQKRGFFNEAIGRVDRRRRRRAREPAAARSRSGLRRRRRPRARWSAPSREWRAGRTGNAKLLLALVMLELWLTEYLPRALLRRRGGPPHDAALRGRHPGAQRGGQPAAPRSRARPRRRIAPRRVGSRGRRLDGRHAAVVAELAAGTRWVQPLTRPAATRTSAGRRPAKGARPRRRSCSASRR